MYQQWFDNNILQILQALDMEEELDLEGRPSRFTNVLIQSSYEDDSVPDASKAKKEETRTKQSKKWRKTGIKLLSTDFRDNF